VQQTTVLGDNTEVMECTLTSGRAVMVEPG
jgi:hypothetical protein